MKIRFHHLPKSINGIPSVAYFNPKYFLCQSYEELVIVENEDLFIPINIKGKCALSIPNSPFGSFATCEKVTSHFHEFESSLMDYLQKKGINEFIIHHPSTIYSSFVKSDQLEKVGYKKIHSNINHHISLEEGWVDNIHKMQQKKLSYLKDRGFNFKEMPHSDLKMAYQFLMFARKAHGLKINISWDLLKKLVEKMPESYRCFGVFKEEKISALCITVNVTETTAYYYLPATSHIFRSQSPMVLLIAGMVDYYQKRGFRNLDLGVSSIQGKPQETLRIFKERMGGTETEKPTFAKYL